MAKIGYKPKWEERHTAIVDSFLLRCELGVEKFYTMNEDGSFTPQTDEENKAECKRIVEHHKANYPEGD